MYVQKIFATKYENTGLIGHYFKKRLILHCCTCMHDHSNHRSDKVSSLISLTQSHLLIYKRTYSHAGTSTHASSTSGNNNQLEYPGKGWLHHVNDLIQMSFS